MCGPGPDYSLFVNWNQILKHSPPYSCCWDCSRPRGQGSLMKNFGAFRQDKQRPQWGRDSRLLSYTNGKYCFQLWGRIKDQLQKAIKLNSSNLKNIQMFLCSLFSNRVHFIRKPLADGLDLRFLYQFSLADRSKIEMENTYLFISCFDFIFNNNNT